MSNLSNLWMLVDSTRGKQTYMGHMKSEKKECIIIQFTLGLTIEILFA